MVTQLMQPCSRNRCDDVCAQSCLCNRCDDACVVDANICAIAATVVVQLVRSCLCGYLWISLVRLS